MFIETTPSASTSVSFSHTVRPSETNVVVVGMANDANRPWLTVSQAAKRIGVSTDFIYHACATEGLKHVRLAGRRGIRISPRQMDDWMARFSTRNGVGVR